MVEYKCNLCDRVFNKKSTYDYHKQRKTNCKKITCDHKIDHFLTIFDHKTNNMIKDENLSNNNGNKKFQCEYCHNNYSNKSHLTRHIKNNCKVKIKDHNIISKDKFSLDEFIQKQIEHDEKILKIQKDYEDKILNILKENEEKFKKLENTIVESKKKVNKKKYIENNIINNGIVNNNNTNINICGLGSEDISKLSSKVLRSMYVCDNDKLFLNSIEGINFNPDLPQNHNISYRNLRSNDCQVYDDNKWSTMDIKEVIKMLISSHSYYLKRIILENNNLKLSKYIKDNILLELIKYNRTIVKQDEIDRVMEDLNITVLDDIEVCHEKIYNSFKRLLYDKTKELNIKSK